MYPISMKSSHNGLFKKPHANFYLDMTLIFILLPAGPWTIVAGVSQTGGGNEKLGKGGNYSMVLILIYV